MQIPIQEVRDTIKFAHAAGVGRQIFFHPLMLGSHHTHFKDGIIVEGVTGIFTTRCCLQDTGYRPHEPVGKRLWRNQQSMSCLLVPDLRAAANHKFCSVSSSYQYSTQASKRPSRSGLSMASTTPKIAFNFLTYLSLVDQPSSSSSSGIRTCFHTMNLNIAIGMYTLDVVYICLKISIYFLSYIVRIVKFSAPNYIPLHSVYLDGNIFYPS